MPGGGAQIGAQRPVAMTHDDAVLVDDRRSLLYVRHLLHRRHIGHRQCPGLLGVGQPFPEDVDGTQPEGLHLGQYLLLRALAHGQHHDDRRHADDDAQQRESGAQPVQPHHPPGRAQDLRQVRQQRQPAPSAQRGPVLRRIPSWRRFSAASAQRVQVGQVGRGFCRYVCRRLGARPAVLAYRRIGMLDRRIGMPEQRAVVGHGPVGCRQRTRLPVDGGRCVPHDPAVSHRDDAPCPGRHGWIVGDQDQRVTGSRQFVQLLHYLLATRRIQRSGRLVGQNHSPAVDQCPGNRHPLLLAARELVGQVLQTLRQAQSREQGGRTLVPCQLAHPRIAGRHRHIVQCRGRADQVVALEDEAEHLAPQRGQRIVVQPRDRLALEQVLTAAGTVQAAQDVHQRRLARARCPDDGHVLACADP